MHDLLFVYGSLIARIAHAKGEHLRREADLLGAGQINARLYRVSWYPCIVPSDLPGDYVDGEVYRLRTPAATMVWLDAYEGLAPDPSSVAASDEYARVQRAVTLYDGRTLQAWIYQYQRPVEHLTRINSGRWEG